MKLAGGMLASMMAFLSGCGQAPPATEAVTPEKREETRQSLYLNMIKEEGCYMNSLDYAIRDREFLDHVVTRLLAGKTLDAVILSDSVFTSSGGTYEVARMLREAPAAYAAETRTSDGIARLEALIADRFEHPKIEMRQGIVIVNYGHVAAKLLVQAERIVIDFSHAPHLDENREWRAEEMKTAMEYQLKMHPAAAGVRMIVLIPGNPKGAVWTYEYLRSTDRVSVSTKTA